jgi:hypothetical protein
MAGIKLLGLAILGSYPEAKLDLSDENTARTWTAILDDVPDGVLLSALREHVRSGNRFAPNAGEIAKLCGLEAKRPVLASRGDTLQLDAEVDRIREKYHRMGLPSPSEARRQGIKFSEWKRMVEAHGQ